MRNSKSKVNKDGSSRPWANIIEFVGALAFKPYIRRIEGDQYLMIPISELGELLETATKIRVGNMKVKIRKLTNDVKRLELLNEARKKHARVTCRYCLGLVEEMKK